MAYQKPPDGGWGWVIVTVSFFILFLAYGSPLAVGVLYLEWLEVFEEGKGKTAWVGSLAAGVGLLASPLCSAWVSSFGARPVTIFSGVMVAGGLILSSFAPSLYFLLFSYGIVVGSSVGHFIYAALQRELIELYGLPGCLQIVGALSLNILACGILMRPLNSSEKNEKPGLEILPSQYLLYHEKDQNDEENITILERGSSEEKNVKNVSSAECKQENLLNKNGLVTMHTRETENYKKKVAEQSKFCKRLAKKKWQVCLGYWEDTVVLFKNKVFSALFIAILLFDIGGFPPMLLLEDIAKSSNISEEDYFMPLISIVGIMTAVGKLALGILADFKWVNTLYLYVFTLVGCALTLFAIPFAKTYTMLAIPAGALGFFFGNWSIFPYVTTMTVGLEKLTHAYGILMFFAGTGNSLGPPLIGWFYDWMQTYDMAFYFSGLCVLFGALLLLLAALPCWDSCRKQGPKLPPNACSYKAACAT
ncbi:monocarboxylate transporter 9 isoform X2 [Rhinatrema bivittatum]|uniref:monocarboxylate transporter 9 isoform X2 n=1 Tax=Rhinatrema bivittatum TaxID=194408 RepID=UPI00112A89FA|nr:monocarboxylate transporter 9 isoform X2 [Rhinatrema bivittatum]